MINILLSPGVDADLMKYSCLRHKTNHSLNPVTAYDGWTVNKNYQQF